MSKLKKDNILQIANLAKLDLSDSEINSFTQQLSNVIEHFSELGEVDTENEEATSQVTGLENVTRFDLVKAENGLTQEKALSGTDRVHNGYFKVKAVLEGRTDK